MKHISALCFLMLIGGCSENGIQSEDHSQVVTKIKTSELIEAFITYVHKAENPETDMKDKMRQELQEAKNDPLLAPYVFTGAVINRTSIMDHIEKAKEKWVASDIPLSKTATYASKKSNLEKLSNAELVMAFRLMDQVANKVEKK
jgi:hypothetical protein